MIPILKKEFNSFFASPIAYLVIGVFGFGYVMWLFANVGVVAKDRPARLGVPDTDSEVGSQDFEMKILGSHIYIGMMI